MTSEELRAWRKQHGLSRTQVAALLSVAPGTVRNWEQGARNMPAPTDLLLKRATRTEIARVKREHPPKRRGRRRRTGASDASSM